MQTTRKKKIKFGIINNGGDDFSSHYYFDCLGCCDKVIIKQTSVMDSCIDITLFIAENFIYENCKDTIGKILTCGKCGETHYCIYIGKRHKIGCDIFFEKNTPDNGKCTAGVYKNAVDKFIDFLDACSDEVNTWSKWKNEILRYIAARKKTINASIDAEVLAGNKIKESCERTALAEIIALERELVLIQNEVFKNNGEKRC